MKAFLSLLIGLGRGGAPFPGGALLPGPTWTYVVIYSAFKGLNRRPAQPGGCQISPPLSLFLLPLRLVAMLSPFDISFSYPVIATT